ncbi:MAG: hypothetical protein ACI4HQ_08620 [Acetatifactor sp.]
MTELLKTAWQGWIDYTMYGKLAALLLVSLLFLRAYYEKLKYKELWIYSIFATVCCMLPMTAAVLMLYQTRFYEYRWIWSMVPLTAVIGYAVTVFLTEYLPEQGQKGKKKIIPAAVLLLAVFLLSGSLDSSLYAAEGQKEQEHVEAVLANLRNRRQDRELVLWAPREIMEYAREYDSSIRLLYGRNIWEPSLNVYIDDVYTPEIVELQCWMDAPESGKEREGADAGTADVMNYLTIASEKGVNCILLPENTEDDTVKLLESYWNTKGEALDGYYLFVK